MNMEYLRFCKLVVWAFGYYFGAIFDCTDRFGLRLSHL